MIDFRYHLVSLISVFLALAVGIVLGAGPLKESIGDTLTGEVDALRQRAADLRTELDAAAVELAESEAAFESVADDLVAGTLAERRVAIVTFGDADGGASDDVAARVELGDTSVKMTLPSGRGPTPMLFYKSHDIPYDQVHTVETRREIYGGSLVPVLLKGARLITKDEKSIPIGYVSEANVDPCFPYPEIARQIADRARLPLIDRGNVRRSFRRKFFGIKGSRVNEVDLVSEAQIADLNKSHHNMVLGLVGGLALLIVIGIVDDLASETPIGQTASAGVVASGKLAPQKK